jgi:diacylglycerol kinase family enzyme
MAAETKIIRRSCQRVFDGLVFAIQDRLRAFPFGPGNAIARAMGIPAAVDLEVIVGFGKWLEMVFGQKKTSSENV